MRVLVTGAAGFLGSAVCGVAAAHGDEVTGLVRAGELSAPVPGVSYQELVWGSEPALLSGLVDEVRAEAVIHCAGATPRVNEDVVALYDANVQLTWVLLAAIAQSVGRPRAVMVSSAAVYGPIPPTPTPEDSPPAPASHYAWSKVLAEDVVQAFVRAGQVRACVARPFNMLGRGEPAGSVVSDVVNQLQADTALARVSVREMASIRDYVDVHDAARALLILAERGAVGEAYNVCTGFGVSVGELVGIILSVWESGAEIEVVDPTSPGTVSVGWSEKLRALGWTPQISLAASLEQVRSLG